jgi:hypothetical protein
VNRPSRVSQVSPFFMEARLLPHLHADEMPTFAVSRILEAMSSHSVPKRLPRARRVAGL